MENASGGAAGEASLPAGGGVARGSFAARLRLFTVMVL